MKRFKNHLIAAAALSVLAIIGTIMNSHQAAAQPPGPPGGLAVNIVNPVPVPVTGSTTVSGTVAATQSGSWSVGIQGTPQVQVTNLSSSPVVTADVSKFASNIVELECDPNSATLSPCILSTPGAVNGGTFTVPPGQKFVLTSADLESPPGSGNIVVTLFQGPAGIRKVRENWIIPAGSSMIQLQFPSGIVIQSGEELSLTDRGNSNNTFSDDVLHGYL